MEQENLHIGQIIKQKVEEAGMKKADFAKAINCCRGNVYHIFKCAHLNKQQLETIEKTLRLDLSSQMNKISTETKRYVVIIESDEKQLQEIITRYTVVNYYSVK